MHLLLVEDDERLARALTRLLEEDRHIVEHALDGRTGLELATAMTGLDAIILDIGLPDISGLEVARRIRKAGLDVNILMLTARDTVNDRVLGLDAGADDYVVKPFAYQEVAARLRALGRRSEPGPRRAEPKLQAGAIVLDEAARRVTVNGRPIDLSPREFSLLEALLRHVGRVLSRDQLLDHAWPFSVAVTPNAVDAYVHYLRTKLGEAGAQIETVRGVGYRLDDVTPHGGASGPASDG
jgi:DNA-binding response OmpR family regulator